MLFQNDVAEEIQETQTEEPEAEIKIPIGSMPSNAFSVKAHCATINFLPAKGEGQARKFLSQESKNTPVSFAVLH